MAPRTSLFALVVDLATADGVDPSDPPPWCYAQWLESGSGELPPWHPSQEPSQKAEERRHQEAAADMFARYREMKSNPKTSPLREKALKETPAATKKKVAKWIQDDFRACRFNTRLDRVDRKSVV